VVPQFRIDTLEFKCLAVARAFGNEYMQDKFSKKDAMCHKKIRKKLAQVSGASIKY